MISFAVIALLTLGSAAVAMALRNLIHSALLLVASWAGIAAFYLWAGAEFVAFAQVLVYVGAVSMIVLFAVLLTRRSPGETEVSPAGRGRFLGAMIVGGGVLGVLFGAVLGTDIQTPAAPVAPAVATRALGTQLMTTHAAALLIVGAILTVTLLGAIVLAAVDRDTDSPPSKPQS